MESSPLTQQFQGTFEPKIGELYLYLFNALANEGTEDAVPTEGFWRELFLLNPDKNRLYQILDPLTSDDVLLTQVCSASSDVLGAYLFLLLDANQNLLPKSYYRSRIRNSPQ